MQSQWDVNDLVCDETNPKHCKNSTEVRSELAFCVKVIFDFALGLKSGVD